MKPPATFQSIQALRGVAATLVIIFHAGLHQDPGATIFRTGNAGVDIFFVISGFVMWTVTARRPVAPGMFLLQRGVRLVPLYWIMTGALIAGFAVMPGAFPHMHPNMRHIALSLAFVPHVSPDTGSFDPVLGQGWTLNFEMFFYILFAVALGAPARLRLMVIAAMLVVLPLLGLFAMTASAPPTVLLNPLLLEFLAGLLLARGAGSGWRPRRAWCWVILALGSGLLALASPGASDDWARTVQYGIPASLIVAGAVGLELCGRGVPRLLRAVGDSSYSTYLSHSFVISLLGKLWPWSGAWLFMAAATGLALLGGELLSRLVERPLLALMRPLISGPIRISGAGLPAAVQPVRKAES